ncbi:hypothetical protein QLL95_gp0869 [Cotonvirus japonicus]|uniref:Uncharacterized protein n=1 Tax=Cotonvirus japonicus TaxID=2811091 RepID=A0ABM7NSV8_9VIRU|nr:hypothetical protein QLL95_gp0869 [Cotonvirus japonicus]BCS83254.1 hypothetical protein [Cotonvirus japonicus]
MIINIMQFVPMGGFPPIVKKNNKNLSSSILETRGFSSNIVDIEKIINSKKKKDLYLAFGSDNENSNENQTI